MTTHFNPEAFCTVVLMARTSNQMYVHLFLHTLPAVAVAAVTMNARGMVCISTQAFANAPVHLLFRRHHLELRSYYIDNNELEYDHNEGDELICLIISNDHNRVIGNNETTYHHGNIRIRMDEQYRQQSLNTIRDNLWFDEETWLRLRGTIHSIGGSP